jgi:hypothetical protein
VGFAIAISLAALAAAMLAGLIALRGVEENDGRATS